MEEETKGNSGEVVPNIGGKAPQFTDDEEDSSVINIRKLAISADIASLLDDLEKQDVPKAIRESYNNKVKNLSKKVSRMFTKIVEDSGGNVDM
jgi:hypothetical protein